MYRQNIRTLKFSNIQGNIGGLTPVSKYDFAQESLGNHGGQGIWI